MVSRIMRKRLVIFAPLLALSVLQGCGGGGGDTAASKDLFSIWNRDSDNARIDLRGGAFDTNLPWVQTYSNGAQCSCVARASGDQSSGVFVINQCRYVRGTAAGDPGCASQGIAGQYSNANGTLTITSGSTQEIYH